VHDIYGVNVEKQAQLSQKDRATHYQLKSCQLLHSCTKKSCLKSLAVGEGPQRSLKVIGIVACFYLPDQKN